MRYYTVYQDLLNYLFVSELGIIFRRDFVYRAQLCNRFWDIGFEGCDVRHVLFAIAGAGLNYLPTYLVATPR